MTPKFCHIFRVGFLLRSLIIVAMAAGNARFSAGQEPTAAEKFVHISELHAMPAAQMGKVMNIMSASLGVNCQYCHSGNDFAKEDVPHKDVAREMIAMTFKLNADYFKGRTEITCYTCHRGQARPRAAISVDAFETLAAKAQPPLVAPIQMSVSSVLNKFVDAIGGPAQLAAIKSRHIIAKRIEPSGRSEAEELWQTVDGRSRIVTLYGDLPVIEGFDGSTAWKRAGEQAISLKFDESSQIVTEAKLAFGAGVKTAFNNLKLASVTLIDGHEAIELVSPGLESLTERLYFDIQSGLLIRRTSSMPTVLGEFTYQVDYQDYREFAGVKLPTKLRFNIPNVSWDRVVTEVETNVDIDESIFQNR